MDSSGRGRLEEREQWSDAGSASRSTEGIGEIDTMAKKDKKISTKTSTKISGEGENREKRGPGKLLQEIIEESLSPDCNRILLEGKIKDFEESQRECLPLLRKKIRSGSVAEQKVIFSLMVRKKNKEVSDYLRQISDDKAFSVLLRREAILQRSRWGEPVDEALRALLEQAEEVIYAVEKNAQLGDALGQGLSPEVAEKFSSLPRELRTALVRDLLEDNVKTLRVVLRLIRSEEDLDEDIIDRLGEIGTQEVGEFFARVLGESKNKGLRRVLKRHLFQLQSKGLEVSLPRLEEEGSPKFVKAESTPASAFITGIDYLGERLAFIDKPVPGWGSVFFQISLSDQEGIKNLSAFDLSRKEVKSFLNRVSEEGVIQLIEVNPEYCYYLVHQAFQINLQKGIPLPGAYTQWKGEIDELKGLVTEPLIYSVLPRPSREELTFGVSRDNYAMLCELRGLKDWFLEPRLVWEYVEKYREADESPLVLDGQQRENRKELVFSEAAGTLFTAPLRRTYQRRLEEMAYVLFCTDQREEAELALHAAADLDPEGLPSQGHGFLCALVKRSVLLYCEAEKENRRRRNIMLPR